MPGLPTRSPSFVNENLPRQCQLKSPDNNKAGALTLYDINMQGKDLQARIMLLLYTLHDPNH